MRKMIISKGGAMKVRHIAEAIILQSIEDLWVEDLREECIKFFSGKDFRTCASVAGIDVPSQIKILNMVGKSIKGLKSPAKAGKRTCLNNILLHNEIRQAARP